MGYANLGALLMNRGLAYDSVEGRDYAAAITALMHGEALPPVARSSRATTEAPFDDYDVNRESVPARHPQASRRRVRARRSSVAPRAMVEYVRAVCTTRCSTLGEQHGYRNAQVTVLAPTGTIAFMMDCDTTGIEPDIALIKYKKLVGEGYLKIVNQTVPAALRKLGYSPDEVEEIIAYVNERETIEGAPGLKPEHLPVFDCAFKPVNGERSIHYMGHVRMMGCDPAVPLGRDQQDREHARGRHGRGDRDGLPRGLEAGPQGHRDLPRRLQALPAALDRQEEGRRHLRRGAETIESLRRQLAAALVEATARPAPAAGRAPAITHKFDITGHEGYITVGLYADGQPGEIFLKMAKEGSTISGLMDTLGDLDQPGAPVRRAARGPGEQVRPRAVRAQRASPATRRSRSPSRSSTTSSAGSARASCRRRIGRPSG